MSKALHIKWPKHWSFSFCISPPNEYPGLISFRIDCFYLLGVQGTLKSLLQHHSSKTSVLWHLPFFMVQLSHVYMTMDKPQLVYTDLCQQSGVCLCVFVNTLSSFVIAFLPRSKHLLISWLQSTSAVILEPQKIKSVTASAFPV